MTKLLLNKYDLSEIMGLPPDTARAELVARGVYPVDFGRGRGRGHRWYAHAVQQAIADMHAEAQAKTLPKVRKVCTPDPFFGKSTSQIYAELVADRTLQ